MHSALRMISKRCARPGARTSSAQAHEHRAAPAASTAMYGAASSPVSELRTRFPNDALCQPPSTWPGLYPMLSRISLL